jgi:amino acid transporter
LTFFKGFDAFMPFQYKSFITHYIGIPVYVFGYIGYKRKPFNDPTVICIKTDVAVVRKTKAVKMDEMDLTTGSREFADLEGEDEDNGYSEMNWKQKAVYNLKHW